MVDQVAIQPIDLRCDRTREIATMGLESGNLLSQLLDPPLKGCTLKLMVFAEVPKVPEAGQVLNATTDLKTYKIENGTEHSKSTGYSFHPKLKHIPRGPGPTHPGLGRLKTFQ